MATWQRQACQRCGGPKGPGIAKRLCDDCKELAEWRAQKKRDQSAILRRMPCRRCGKNKGPGKGAYCPTCRAERKKEGFKELKPCLRCWGPKEPGDYKVCKKCKKDPGYRPHRSTKPCQVCGGPKSPGCGKKICDICRANKKLRYAEHQRMKRRLEAERRGQKVKPVTLELYEKRYGASRSGKQSVPCEMLVPILKSWIEKHDRANSDIFLNMGKGMVKGNGAVKHLAEQSGVSERRINDLTSGRQTRATKSTIDRLCIAMGITMGMLPEETLAA